MQSLSKLSLFSLCSLSHLTNDLFLPFRAFSTKTPNSEMPAVVSYLMNTFNLSEPFAKTAASRFSGTKTPQNLQSVVHYFTQIGFSPSQIKICASVAPQILFTNPQKTLKPKIDYLQSLGLTGSDLGLLISKNPTLMLVSLRKRLIPSVETFKEILSYDNSYKFLSRVLMRCSWGIARGRERILSNVSYLKSCGIVGSQLSMLLKRQPRVFTMPVSDVKKRVSWVLDLGFSKDSRMLVHAVHTVCSISRETFERKMKLFQSFGFSEGECFKMFRRAPVLFRVSERKLRLGIEFFMNRMKFDKAALVSYPTCLMNSLDDRVIPRYRVVQLLKSKKLVKKTPNFMNILSLTEKEFLEKYIVVFRDDAEEILMAYKGHLLESS